jgi:hypothetical protein
MGWREHIPIHPAADLFPLMSESELRELGEDIKARGLVSPIIKCGDALLDGGNRLDAMELVGMKLGFAKKGKLLRLSLANSRIVDGAANLIGEFSGDPYDYVLSANLHRRHLNGEQKRELIAKVLKAKPEASNSVIAKQVKADDKTCRARRLIQATKSTPKYRGVRAVPTVLRRAVRRNGRHLRQRRSATPRMRALTIRRKPQSSVPSS